MAWNVEGTLKGPPGIPGPPGPPGDAPEGPALGYQNINTLGTVQSLSPPPGANIARIFVLSGEVRHRDDGGTPTETDGALWGEGIFFVTLSPATSRLIQATPGSRVVVEFFA